MSGQLSPIDRLRRAAELSQQFAVAAGAGDWPEATRLESERRALIEAAFADGPPGEPGEVAELIQQVIAVDKRVMELAIRSRGEAAAELAALQKGRRVSKAYRDTER